MRVRIMTNYDYLRPIGTVVSLKDIEKVYMIIAVLQSHQDDPDRIYDYIGVPYPEGQVDSRLNLMFNDDQIEEEIYRGYEDTEGKRDSFLMVLDFVMGSQDALKQAIEEVKAEEANGAREAEPEPELL